VAAVVKSPNGIAGRPSKSLTLAQAQALLQAAQDSRLHAYVVLSVTSLRTDKQGRHLPVDTPHRPSAQACIPAFS
jgi:hypothetical protein